MKEKTPSCLLNTDVCSCTFSRGSVPAFCQCYKAAVRFSINQGGWHLRKLWSISSADHRNCCSSSDTLQKGPILMSLMVAVTPHCHWHLDCLRAVLAPQVGLDTLLHLFSGCSQLMGSTGPVTESAAEHRHLCTSSFLCKGTYTALSHF